MAKRMTRLLFPEKAAERALVAVLAGMVAFASAETFDLATATVADVNRAFDAGALDSEKLVSLYLARIDAYEDRGPKINCLVSLNSDALETARALDRERAQQGPRSLLHGIPVVLKDNIDTYDMPTTGGSFLLEGWTPSNDAHLVKRLREAGAIILAKTNLDDFATRGTGYSSVAGQTRNPHNPDFSPAGSSGGSGACAAAWFAQIAVGTDTGGSLRSPASVGGLVGVKASRGLIPRRGLIPTCYSFDYAGPMARSVYDAAAALGAMSGFDKHDRDATSGMGHFHSDYTPFLRTDALRGARIGVVRHAGGVDQEVDGVFARAVKALEAQGAVVIDPIVLPEVLTNGWRVKIMGQVCDSEKPYYFDEYLSTLPNTLPGSFAELARAGAAVRNPVNGRGAFPKVYERFESRVAGGSPRDSLAYLSMRQHGVGLIRLAILGVFEAHALDAIVYTTRSHPPHLIEENEPFVGRIDRSHYAPGPEGERSGVNLRNIANIAGLPDVVVPAGWSAADMPISISFLGPAFSEVSLLSMAYAFEQATRQAKPAQATPRLMGEIIHY